MGERQRCGSRLRFRRVGAQEAHHETTDVFQDVESVEPLGGRAAAHRATVIWLHGMGEDGNDWRRQLVHTIGKGRYVTALPVSTAAISASAQSADARSAEVVTLTVTEPCDVGWVGGALAVPHCKTSALPALWPTAAVRAAPEHTNHAQIHSDSRRGCARPC